jgi:hypothetical protein
MSALIHPKTIKVDGLSVRYAEGGQAGPDAILMSPWPERKTAKSDCCFGSTSDRRPARIGNIQRT